jgi:hypothetical protein
MGSPYTRFVGGRLEGQAPFPLTFDPDLSADVGPDGFGHALVVRRAGGLLLGLQTRDLTGWFALDGGLALHRSGEFERRGDRKRWWLGYGPLDGLG